MLLILPGLLYALLGGLAMLLQVSPADTTDADTTDVDSTTIPPQTVLELATFRITQVAPHLPRPLAYLRALDATRRMPGALPQNALQATLHNQPVIPASVTPFAETGEGLAYVFLVDISRSLSDSRFAEMQGALIDWIEQMQDADRATVITFGSDVQQVIDFTADTDTLTVIVEGLAPTDLQTTLRDGLLRAIQVGQRTDPNLPRRRAIITLSDGDDDSYGTTTEAELLEAMRVNPIPIYAIGFFTPPRTNAKEAALEKLGTYARTSGGELFMAEQMPLPDIYQALRQSIREVFVVALEAGAFTADGTDQDLRLLYTSGFQHLSDRMTIRLYPDLTPRDDPEVVLPQPARPWGLYVLMGVVGLGLIIGAVVLVRRRRKQIPEPAEDTEATKRSFPEAREKALVVVDEEAPAGGGQARYRTPAVAIRLMLVRGVEQEIHAPVLQKRLVLGKGGSSEIVIAGDPQISREHCALVLDADEEVYLEDLGSTNGTEVNGIRISGRYRIQPGDLLTLGQTELRIEFTGAER